MVKDFEVKLEKVEDFVATLLPLHIHTQLGEAFEVVLRSKAYKRFAVYSAERLESFSELLMLSCGRTRLPSKHDY